MGLKAWHIYALVLIPVVLLIAGVTYGANTRDGSELLEPQVAAPEDEGENGDGEEPGGDGEEPADDGGGGAGGLEITATDNEFNNEELTAAAGAEVTLELTNEGSSLHNWIVEDQDIATELIPGGETATVTFTLEAGEYDYLCEVHPQEMTGTLIVE